MNEYPAQDVLVARGKYSTLAGERRALLREMRDGLEGLVNCSGRVLRRPDDLVLMEDELRAMKALIGKVDGTFSHLVVLHTHMEELKPLAWGAKERIEHE
jgi:hypothetical protein